MEYVNSCIAVAGLVWMAKYILMPMRDGHIKFLSSVSGAVETQAQTIAKVEQTLAKVENTLVGIDGGLARVKSVILRAENVTIIPRQQGASNDPGSGR